MWFNHLNREKYPSTLYITIKSLNKPTYFRPGLRSALHGGIEEIQKEFQDVKVDLDE